MTNLLGTYECKVDAKGRIMFPVTFKNQMGEKSKQGFVIKKNMEIIEFRNSKVYKWQADIILEIENF